MNKLDLDYQNLLKDILDNGVEKDTRSGKVLSVFGRTVRHKMSEGFPLLTTKKMAWKQIVTELQWFLRGETNIQSLVKQGNYIWVGDAYKYYESIECNPPHDHSLNKKEFIEKIKTDDNFAKKWGEMGKIYGHQWRKWGEHEEYIKLRKGGEHTIHVKGIDQIDQVIQTLRTNPDSRRMMVNAWNVAEIDNMKLPPCHYGFQVYTRELSDKERYKIWFSKNYETGMEYDDTKIPDFDNSYYERTPKRAISLMWQQRSIDTPLGLPFNIASYGLLLLMLADEVGMYPYELIGNLGDTHIYQNQVDGVKEQLKREPFELPTVHVRAGINSTWDDDDIVLENYKSHGKINLPLSN